MFCWLNKQGVKGDKGFIVQSVGRFTIEYCERSKKISVHVEPGFSGGHYAMDGLTTFAVFSLIFLRHYYIFFDFQKVETF